MTLLTRSLPVILIFLLLPRALPAQPQSLDGAVQERVRARIEAERRGLDGLIVDGDTVHTSTTVAEFYETTGFDPVWIGPNGALPVADDLHDALQRAHREGLQPSHYHADSIASLLQRTEPGRKVDVGLLSDLELLCTDAFLLYASDLLSGHVSPTSISPSWNVTTRKADLRQKLQEATTSGSVTAALKSVRPPQPEYTALKAALRQYRAIMRNGGWPTIPDGPALERDSTGPRINTLRRRVAITGDLPGPLSSSDKVPREFDERIETAVTAFQERHGLTPDGVVESGTLAALNVPVEERVQQLIVNLERFRWMPESLGRKHILVNIAAAELQIVENGEEIESMRVVTGLPFRQTPVFSGEISYLVLNPFWHVPHSIATEDKLPKIKQDPSYLQRQNMKVFRGWGANETPVDPSTVNWANLSADNFPYRLRQDPGPYNALGRIKFMFPNPHSVYLHDTPTRGDFARAERNFSSGCIRVQRPLDLAEYVLADHPQWSRTRMESVLKNPSNEQSVPLRTRIPIHLQYRTAWSTPDGTIHFRKDSYTRDDPVYQALMERSTE